MSVVIHGQFLYYTAWNRQRITRINKATGSKVTFMTNHPELGRLDSLDIFTGDSVDVNRICSKNNGGCSTFCFPTPTGRTCGCQDNVNLQPDQKTLSRCETSLQNVNFPDCLPYSGQTCPVACKSGYKLVSNTSVTCDQSGQWTPSPNPFCMEIFCTSAIDNALFSPECTRKAGESCTFSCNNGFTQTTSENLLCTSNGTWNMDTKNLCLRSGCSKTMKNGHFINCRSRIEETCRYECTGPFKVNPSFLNVTCNKSDEWSHDTNDLCVRLCSSSIQNGRLDRGCERKIGNICSYTCDPNYRPSIPSSKIVCTVDGAWNENTGEICKPSGCSKAIRNGQLINCLSNIQETCEYRCFSTLEINPSVPNITCKENGTWSDDTNNLCVHLCPSTIRNGKLDESCIRNIGNKCSYSCDINYRPSLSSPNIVCTSGSTWNENTDGLCKPSGCSKTIQNGKLINCQANIRETCRYECNALFEVNPLSQNVTCNEDGEWSHDVKDLCLRACASIIRNGKLDKGCQRKIGNICSFSCDSNYSSSLHSSRIVCTSNGTWNENTNELCKRSSCSTTMKNGQFINCQPRIGETCKYECHGLLNVNPSVPNVTCNENGQWSHDTNNLCVRLCSSTIQSGKLDRGCQRKIGSICFYTCDPNFRSSVPSSRIVCTLNGTWNTNTDELCKPVECSKKIRNGQLINCQSNIQETCQYRCFSPLKINPSVPNITCKENGTWSDDTNNLCVHLCPSTIRNGKLDEGCRRNIGNKCTYSCDVSYRSSLSSSSIVCTSGATWNENTDGLCKASGCSKTIQNGKLIYCQANIRESCRYECIGLFEVNSLAQNVTCNENGEWSHDVKDLCIRACPSIIRNGKLDKGCQRKIGNICSFSCDINYSSSLHSANVICTSNGTWNENTNELCKPSGCTKTIQNGKLVNCSSNSGEICRYECIDHFYINPLIPAITCSGGGEWNHETNNLCVRLCSSIIPHGKIAPNCERKIGDRCSFICDSNYQSSISSSSIVCTSTSTWNENINTICKRITCPLQIPDGYVSSQCNGHIGEICEVGCRNESNATSVQLICTSLGSWNKDINNICTQYIRNISSHHVTGNSFETYVLIGASIAGLLIIVIVVTVCFLKKRNSSAFKYAQAQDEPQEMFLNPLYNLK